ncbi:hypothetical protein, partial [Piscicoccus intestinalis]|uniref:hypothetical protein n=1 Tax=Piscicoccus intestinalis TaxID=746033 RepID=UPI001C3F1917
HWRRRSSLTLRVVLIEQFEGVGDVGDIDPQTHGGGSLPEPHGLPLTSKARARQLVDRLTQADRAFPSEALGRRRDFGVESYRRSHTPSQHLRFRSRASLMRAETCARPVESTT